MGSSSTKPNNGSPSLSPLKKRRAFSPSPAWAEMKKKQQIKAIDMLEISVAVKQPIDRVESIVRLLESKGILLEKGVLGEGGNAFILRAFDEVDKLALKIQKCENKEDIQNIKHEFAIQQQFSSEFVTRVHDMLELKSDSATFMMIVMERCKYDLKSFMKQKKWLSANKTDRDQQPSPQSIPRLTFLQVALQLAKGLQVLHAQNILHLDIKPANLLFGFDETWKYADLGVSKSLTGDKDHTSHLNGFTACYASPEQYQMMSFNTQRKITKASDVFSLGVVFLEMTGIELNRKWLLQHKISKIPWEQEFNTELMDINEKLIIPMLENDDDLRMELSVVISTLETWFFASKSSKKSQIRLTNSQQSTGVTEEKYDDGLFNFKNERRGDRVEGQPLIRRKKLATSILASPPLILQNTNYQSDSLSPQKELQKYYAQVPKTAAAKPKQSSNNPSKKVTSPFDWNFSRNSDSDRSVNSSNGEAESEDEGQTPGNRKFAHKRSESQKLIMLQPSIMRSKSTYVKQKNAPSNLEFFPQSMQQQQQQQQQQQSQQKQHQIQQTNSNKQKLSKEQLIQLSKSGNNQSAQFSPELASRILNHNPSNSGLYSSQGQPQQHQPLQLSKRLRVNPPSAERTSFSNISFIQSPITYSPMMSGIAAAVGEMPLNGNGLTRSQILMNQQQQQVSPQLHSRQTPQLSQSNSRVFSKDKLASEFQPRITLQKIDSDSPKIPNSRPSSNERKFKQTSSQQELQSYGNRYPLIEAIVNQARNKREHERSLKQLNMYSKGEREDRGGISRVASAVNWQFDEQKQPQVLESNNKHKKDDQQQYPSVPNLVKFPLINSPQKQISNTNKIGGGSSFQKSASTIFDFGFASTNQLLNHHNNNSNNNSIIQQNEASRKPRIQMEQYFNSKLSPQ